MSTKNPPIEVRRSPIHGTGVYASRRIRKNEEIIFYEGALITHEESEEEDDNGHTFLFTLNKKWVIDANMGGNDARWINHGCDPNCEALLIEDEDGNLRKDKMVIQAIRTIQPGEELTYDYNIVTDEPIDERMKKMWKCLCGAKNCRGIIVRPKKKKKKKNKKDRKKDKAKDKKKRQKDKKDQKKKGKKK